MSRFDVDTMMATVSALVEHGARRPGSLADLAAEDYLEGRLAAAGLVEVRREAIPIRRWTEGETTLEATAGDGSGAIRPEVQAIPYARFTPEGGVEGPLVAASAGGDWRGAIVAAEIGFPPIDTKLMLKISMGSYDPRGTLDRVDHPATWVRLGWHLYRRAVAKGAAGFVGVLKDQPGGTCRMFGPYGFRERDILDKPVPGVWVGRDDGARLLRLAEAGGARARLVVRGTDEPGVTHNIVGEVPGGALDDEAIVLSCHHDSPFDSPVEDATGCSVVLALAGAMARERPLRRRLIVLFSAGHFYGSIGTRSFIEGHPEVVKRAALEVSIEHVALEAIEGPDGSLVPSGEAEAMALFVSFSRAIADALLDAAKAHDLDRSILLPAEGPLGNYPPTDGGDWYAAGVPVINCISNPVYLLTDQDALRWVDRDRLPRVASAFDEVIRRLDALPREAIASTKSWPYRLAMKGLDLAARAALTRLGTRPLH